MQAYKCPHCRVLSPFLLAYQQLSRCGYLDANEDFHPKDTAGIFIPDNFLFRGTEANMYDKTDTIWKLECPACLKEIDYAGPHLVNLVESDGGV